ncbi:MAG: hypothetical protein Q8M22_04815 [Actinomycetota bacterium]|nr:hypothetical protein [Actinomycetota bacterium]
MSEPCTYEIVIRGRAGARLLRPFLDDFTVDRSQPGLTRLSGEVRDPAHLHGLLVHLTAINGELVSLAQVSRPLVTEPLNTQHERSMNR